MPRLVRSLYISLSGLIKQVENYSGCQKRVRIEAESLGLRMSGVRHPPANDAADHVTETRSARSATTRSATPFRECKHYQAVFKRGIQVAVYARCDASTVSRRDWVFRRRSTKHSPSAQIFQRHHPHATDILIHPATYASPLSTP